MQHRQTVVSAILCCCCPCCCPCCCCCRCCCDYHCRCCCDCCCCDSECIALFSTLHIGLHVFCCVCVGSLSICCVCVCSLSRLSGYGRLSWEMTPFKPRGSCITHTEAATVSAVLALICCFCASWPRTLEQLCLQVLSVTLSPQTVSLAYSQSTDPRHHLDTELIELTCIGGCRALQEAPRRTVSSLSRRRFELL